MYIRIRVYACIAQCAQNFHFPASGKERIARKGAEKRKRQRGREGRKEEGRGEGGKLLSKLIEDTLFRGLCFRTIRRCLSFTRDFPRFFARNRLASVTSSRWEESRNSRGVVTKRVLYATINLKMVAARRERTRATRVHASRFSWVFSNA